jgi:glycosyltransferase involved in cell wall biosynthesis
MRSWKGINVLLEAANQLRDIPHLRWVIIGGGHAEIHHQKAKELKLEGIVHFTGHLDNPFPAIGSLDCFTLLSTANEGVSQAILQAAYLKKPLIATPTGGLSEVCLHEKTGILVPVFDPEAVAKAVLRLKENEALRKHFGEKAHRLVLDRFTLKNTLDQMEEVYLK